jgi:membrane associated rhomboid family serine protease
VFPIRDTYPTHHFPAINWLIIIANVLVFLFESSLSQGQLDELVRMHGFVADRFMGELGPEQISTIFSSMFLHAGWAHLIGNMWVLGIFGDNIEEAMGHFRYLVFYLLMGVISCMTAVVLGLGAGEPQVGASGAIAGVLGAYAVLFPRSKVLTFVPIFFIPYFFEVSAFFFLFLWFAAQAISFIAPSLGEPGVAWWAHVGGFIAGMVLVRLFARADNFSAIDQYLDDYVDYRH